MLHLEQLNITILQYIPQELQAYCKIGNFIKGRLTILTPDAVWASQLRYHLPLLRDKLRSQAKLYNLISIEIQISQDISSIATSPLTKKSLVLSLEARNAIRTGGEACHYLPLKQALLKLANIKE